VVTVDHPGKSSTRRGVASCSTITHVCRIASEDTVSKMSHRGASRDHRSGHLPVDSPTRLSHRDGVSNIIGRRARFFDSGSRHDRRTRGGAGGIRLSEVWFEWDPVAGIRLR